MARNVPGLREKKTSVHAFYIMYADGRLLVESVDPSFARKVKDNDTVDTEQVMIILE